MTVRSNMRRLLVIGEDSDIRRLLALLDVPVGQRDTDCVEIAFEDWLCRVQPADIPEVLYNNSNLLYNNETAYRWLWSTLTHILPQKAAQWLRAEYGRRNVQAVYRHRERLRGFAVEQKEMSL